MILPNLDVQSLALYVTIKMATTTYYQKEKRDPISILLKFHMERGYQFYLNMH